ncbi:TetR/AcrR family transcriptional regulator [Beijerinckia sp. L45]|uniref:TetR/AcrR family transcriptional regulator n=1 Tax=Beijerinckia sp. L45 TaxID=1641855 RepID=UPI00131B20E3|nr:TetR/AcrR family transcriptional regulator [Beijerinckia sp. L45]
MDETDDDAGLRTRANGKLTKRRLVEACLEHVWDRGYGATSMALVAEAAGTPKGSVFYHFPTKETMIVAAVAEYVEQATARRKRDLLPDAPSHRPTVTRLKRYFHKRMEARRATNFRRGCLLGNLAAEINDEAVPAIAKAVQQGLQSFEEDVASFLTAACHEGEVRSDLHVEEVSSTLVNGWEGALLRMKLSGSPKPLESFIATVPIIIRR